MSLLGPSSATLFVMRRRPRTSTLFPYTTLFRSHKWFGYPDGGLADVPYEELVDRVAAVLGAEDGDRKSTRLNSSHLVISYAVFCLKKKNSKNALVERRQKR